MTTDIFFIWRAIKLDDNLDFFIKSGMGMVIYYNFLGESMELNSYEYNNYHFNFGYGIIYNEKIKFNYIKRLGAGAGNILNCNIGGGDCWDIESTVSSYSFSYLIGI